ncbi:MAG: tyrosine-protein phosphatase, partial [Oscillospiraceae bacterium]|nr:tyrosine-protein phosphatase [Oscillospiraceae bacterium]
MNYEETLFIPRNVRLNAQCCRTGPAGQYGSFAANEQQTGDLNSDGTVDLKDVILLRRSIAGGWEAANLVISKDALERRADGAYTATDKFTGLSGYLGAKLDVTSLSASVFDYSGTRTQTVQIEAGAEWKADVTLSEGYNKVMVRAETADGKAFEESLVIFVPQTLDYAKQALTDLSGVTNARTLSGYINSEGRTIKENVLFRTANLSHITDRAMTLLTEKYHVTDIMDFRYERELNANTVDREVPGTEYHNITMTATEEAANEIFSQNPELFAKFQELQRNAGKPGGRQALTFFQAEIGFFDTERAIRYYESDTAAAKYREVFDLFLNKQEGDAILFHCAGGKDRTGMVSMLMLAALDFDKDIMMQDYMMSNIANAAKIEEITA